jgi:hypothetical protein
MRSGDESRKAYEVEARKSAESGTSEPVRMLNVSAHLTEDGREEKTAGWKTTEDTVARRDLPPT